MKSVSGTKTDTLGIAAIITFIAGLLTCISVGISLLWALSLGYILFFAYGLIKGHACREMLAMSWRGISVITKMLPIFVLIGMLTATWRASGTIAVIIFYASKAIRPEIFVVTTFLLCCGISFLMGTAFGTSATIGVICMTMGKALGISPVILGGAVLSGAFFGDRCSPMSSGAIMIAEITGTDLFRNVRLMLKTGLVPFFIACLVYLLLGLGTPQGEVSAEITELFASSFSLHWTAILPAVLILALSAFRVNVRLTIGLSILLASALCVVLQGDGFLSLLKLYVSGYRSENAELAGMLNGGGILSMLNICAIVCLSSSYSGIFEGTGLLSGFKTRIEYLARRITPFGSVAVTALAANMLACNQTLATILTRQLCEGVTDDDGKMALALENTAVVLAPLIPWNIAGAVPVLTMGAPAACTLAACFLYILPLCRFLVGLKTGREL